MRSITPDASLSLLTTIQTQKRIFPPKYLDTLQRWDKRNSGRTAPFPHLCTIHGVFSTTTATRKRDDVFKRHAQVRYQGKRNAMKLAFGLFIKKNKSKKLIPCIISISCNITKRFQRHEHTLKSQILTQALLLLGTPLPPLISGELIIWKNK